MLVAHNHPKIIDQRTKNTRVPDGFCSSMIDDDAFMMIDDDLLNDTVITVMD
jgi:hypothetical protein